jgi:hypothetical protein
MFPLLLYVLLLVAANAPLTYILVVQLEAVNTTLFQALSVMSTQVSTSQPYSNIVNLVLFINIPVPHLLCPVVFPP